MMWGFMVCTFLSLAPCPNSPNCVSSEAVDARHMVEPFHLRGTPEESLDRLARVIREMSRTKIGERTPSYIHAEFTSKVFHFVDDVEFLYDPNRGVIEVRSASRVGYGDFGVNRKRVEKIRKIYLQG